MAPWTQLVEAYLVQLLLRTPAFHRAVEKVAKNVHRLRHSVPPEEMGGVKIDQPGNKGLLGHFVEEVKTQLTGVERKIENNNGVRGVAEKRAAGPEELNADAAWNQTKEHVTEPPKQSFLREYADALRQQIRRGDKR